MMRYLDDLIGGDWWADEGLPLLDVRVEVRHQLRKYLGVAVFPDGILLAPKGLTEGVVLHELAHLMTPKDEGHGRDFAWTYLMLVRQQMGFFAWAEMSMGIKNTGLFGDCPTPSNN